MFFVKFTCGCVGIRPSTGPEAIILKPCDGDPPSPESMTWHRRALQLEADTPLSVEEEEAIHRQLAYRLALADRYDIIRLNLGIDKTF